MIKKRISILGVYFIVFIGFADLGFANMSLIQEHSPPADTMGDSISEDENDSESIPLAKLWHIELKGLDLSHTDLIQLQDQEEEGHWADFTFRMYANSPVVMISATLDTGAGPELKTSRSPMCHNGYSMMWVHFKGHSERIKGLVGGEEPWMDYFIPSFTDDEICPFNDSRHYYRKFFFDITDFPQRPQGRGEPYTSFRLDDSGSPVINKNTTTFMGITFAESYESNYHFSFDRKHNSQELIDKVVQIFDEAQKIYKGQLRVKPWR